MKCTEEEKNIEIINNLKEYFQNNIDRGYSKFVYNDYGFDEKNVDILNALNYFLENNIKQQKEIEELKGITQSYNSFVAQVSIPKNQIVVVGDKRYFDCGYFIEKHISKDKIKEKIKDLNKEERKQLKGVKGQDRYSIKQEFMYKRSVLEELL